MHLRSALLALIAAASIVKAQLIVEGTVCDTRRFNDSSGILSYAYPFETQEDFNAKLGFCTTIIGPVWIGTGFTGSFVMNNVTNITEHILSWAALDQNDEDANYTTSFLTSIEADNLISLGGINLVKVPALYYIQMLKLEYLETMEINSNPALDMYFPQLKNITGMQILGGYSSLKMDNLVNVDQSMYIGTTNSTNDGDLLHHGVDPRFEASPIAIKFPSLVNATYISLWGNISSISMPNLATSVLPADPNPLYDYFRTGINIQNFGNIVDIIFPSLWNTTGLTISGNLRTVSFSSLLNLPGDYLIMPYNQLAIDFTPLQVATELIMMGNVTYANITSLKYLWYLSVSTDGPFNSCKQMASAWAKLNPKDIPGKAGSNANYSCRGVPKKKFYLSAGAKIGIAIGIGSPVLAAFLWFMNWASQKEEAKRKALEANRPEQPPPAYHMARLDCVPEYGPPEDEMVPEGGVDASHVGETPLLPEYTPPNEE